MVGQAFVGTVKSYSPSKGYGFIVCDEIESDLFFVHKNLSKDVVHQIQYENLFIKEQAVQFTFEFSPEGKPTAAAIRLVNEGVTGSRGPAKGKGKKGAWGNNSWGAAECYEAGKGVVTSYGKSGSKGASKGAKGSKGGKAPREEKKTQEEGASLNDGQRITATMKSYRVESKWGFAVEDSGEWGDIFVHMNNFDESLTNLEIILREGDMIEMRLEDVSGKIVAKDVTLAPQDPTYFDSQWLKGTVKSFQEGSGYGFVTTPRISGDVWFGKSDAPSSLQSRAASGRQVLFKLVIGPDGKPKAKMVNQLEGMEYVEGRTRAQEVIDALSMDGYLDETAVKSLSQTDPNDLFNVLPDLEFYKAENPSSFILGALTRLRKGRGKGVNAGGKGKWEYESHDWGYAPKGKGKGGKGKGKRSSPY